MMVDHLLFDCNFDGGEPTLNLRWDVSCCKLMQIFRWKRWIVGPETTLVHVK